MQLLAKHSRKKRQADLGKACGRIKKLDEEEMKVLDRIVTQSVKASGAAKA